MTNRNTRLTQIFVNGEWQNIDACDLRKGMHFRMFEEDGTPVINTNDNSSSWIAASDIYEKEDGTLAINYELI